MITRDALRTLKDQLVRCEGEGTVITDCSIYAFDQFYGCATVDMRRISSELTDVSGVHDVVMGSAPATPPVCAHCGSQFVVGRISCGCGANRPKEVRKDRT